MATLTSTDTLETMWFTVAVTLCFFSTAADCHPPCQPGCDQCTEYSQCQYCTHGYHYFTTRYGNSLCVKCYSGCDSCESHVRCTKCVKGRHGRNCRSHCGKGCVGGECEQYTGNCICKEFHTGNKCDGCVPGRHGVNCSQICSVGCLNPACNENTGECVCKEGFTGLTCVECTTGRYGDSCQLRCSYGCLEGTCDLQTGSCVCKAEYIGELCDRCVDGKYGLKSNCSLLCPKNCVRCESDKICDVCNMGYYGSTCDDVCPSNCLHGNCSKEGSCHGDCKPGFSGEKCQLCQEAGKYGDNCTETCNEHCVTCSTHEICDKCTRGYYGSDCSEHCSTGCLQKVCHQHNGTCIQGCDRGFTGEYCNCSSNGQCTDNDNSEKNAYGYYPKTSTPLIYAFVIFALIIKA